jgi:predicted  nucleic acid-binding Zn-ribbon protein
MTAPQAALFTNKLFHAMQRALESYDATRVTREDATRIVLLSLRDSGYELVERRPPAPMSSLNARLEIQRLRADIERLRQAAERYTEQDRFKMAEIAVLRETLEKADAVMERASPKNAWDALCEVGDIVGNALAAVPKDK